MLEKAGRNVDQSAPRPHPRTLGWIGTTALAMGGSVLSLLVIGPQIALHGAASIPLTIVGLLVVWVMAYGWIELVLMWPNRVGGISAASVEALRPYSSVLASLTGVCYWWGSVSVLGLTAGALAFALTQWSLPGLSIPFVAVAISIVAVVLFALINLAGIRWTSRTAIVLAMISAGLAIVSTLVPVLTGHVDWRQATTFHLLTPFSGFFGGISSVMAVLLVVGFAARSAEAALCYVGETVAPTRNVPRAVIASGLASLVFFVVLPVVWLGATGLDQSLVDVLGQTFAPLVGGAARGVAIWFLTCALLIGGLQMLSGASRTLMQLAEDGLLPRVFATRSPSDAPRTATLFTAAAAIVLLLCGSPVWLIAGTNVAFLVSMAVPSAAVWLLRRDSPELARPYRAPRGTIVLGVAAAAAWNVIVVFGLQQFGLAAAIAGFSMVCSGIIFYVVRKGDDRRRVGLPAFATSMQLHNTTALLTLLGIVVAICVVAVHTIDPSRPRMIAAIEDLFVEAALLTLGIACILPGIVSYATGQVAGAADRLATGTLADLERAVEALSRGHLNAVPINVDALPLVIHVGEELGAMAHSFNTMQGEIERIAVALDGARENLRQAHEGLESSEMRFRSLVQSASDVICVLGQAGEIQYISPGVEQLLGLAPNDMIGRSGLNLTHPDDNPTVQKVFAIVEARSGERATCELRMRHRDGSWRYVELVVTNMLSTRGVEGLVLNAHDITERHAAAAALSRQYQEAEAARSEMRATLDAASDAMIVVSPDGYVVTVNHSFEEIFLLREADVRGQSFERIQATLAPSFSDHAAFTAAVDAMVRGGDDANRHVAQQWPKHRDLDFFAAPVYDPSGVVIGRLYSFRDVTTEREVDRMKSEFVALVSHELRTPLTSIQGFVELLLEGEVGNLENDQRQFLDIVRRNADRLMTLINALLDLSRIESGKIDLHRTEFDIRPLVLQVFDSFKPQIASRRQTMKLEAESGVSSILGDVDRILQILTNLISNAHKYTPDGGTVTVTVVNAGASVRIDVRDTGIGMTPEEQAQLFTRFYRVRNRATQEVNGTGLGLAITKSLVELHGGAISVVSARGDGSTFRVTLPAATSSSDHPVDIQEHAGMQSVPSVAA